MTTVLIIHDNIDLLTTLHEVLAFNYDYVISALTGDEGSQLANEHHPDIIVTDFWLPDTTGKTLVMNMRQSTALGSVPVILISASHLSKELKNSLPLFDAFLSMPFAINDLIDEINRQLENSRHSVLADRIQVG